MSEEKAYELKNDKVFYQGVECPISPVNERQAIEKFLNKYWNVNIKGQASLSEIIDELLYAGIQRGIQNEEPKAEENLKHISMIAPSYNRFSFKRLTSGTRAPEFDIYKNEFTEKTKKEWKMTASPKGHRRYVKEKRNEGKTDKQYSAEVERLEFDGDMWGGLSVFKESMFIDSVIFNHKEERIQPVNTMIYYVRRQGWGIGVQCVEAKYKDEMRHLYDWIFDESEKKTGKKMSKEEREKEFKESFLE